MSERYREWLHAAEDLRRAKMKELELRKAICADLLQDKREGQVTMTIDGFKVTPKAVLNRTVDEAVLNSIWDKLTDAEKICIQFKPTVVDKNIREFEEHGGLILEAITAKPGLPQLKIEEIL